MANTKSFAIKSLITGNDTIKAKILASSKSTTFIDMFVDLNASLDAIKKAAATGTPTPPQAKSPGVTDNGAKAYGDAYGKAKGIVQKVTDALGPEQVEGLSGLGFNKPSDDKAKRTDILNSVMAAWDKAASSYMKNQPATGDSARDGLKARLDEFDKATGGPKPRPQVKPDT